MIHQNIEYSEQVDIDLLPSADLKYKGTKGTQITIGDLHGNAIKLLFMLVKHGIATNINEVDYKRLVEIYDYKPEDLTKPLLDEFNHILNKMSFSSDVLIRLIGDELADRGSNDYFTLRILEKLNEHHVPVEILVSNHGIEFIEAYETMEDFYCFRLDDPSDPINGARQWQSMKNLQVLLDKGLLTRAEVNNLVEKAYKPNLRAISYSLNEDGKAITIYSHAAIGLNTLEKLAKKFEVSYKDETALSLAQTIDDINKQFQNHVKDNRVNRLYTNEKILAGYESKEKPGSIWGFPFETLILNRCYDETFIKRPAVHHGYPIHYAYGHDIQGPDSLHTHKLDNFLGKSKALNKNPYDVLIALQCITITQHLNDLMADSEVCHPSCKVLINDFLNKFEDAMKGGFSAAVSELDAHVNQLMEQEKRASTCSVFFPSHIYLVYKHISKLLREQKDNVHAVISDSITHETTSRPHVDDLKKVEFTALVVEHYVKEIEGSKAGIEIFGEMKNAGKIEEGSLTLLLDKPDFVLVNDQEINVKQLDGNPDHGGIIALELYKNRHAIIESFNKRHGACLKLPDAPQLPAALNPTAKPFTPSTAPVPLNQNNSMFPRPTLDRSNMPRPGYRPW